MQAVGRAALAEARFYFFHLKVLNCLADYEGEAQVDSSLDHEVGN